MPWICLPLTSRSESCSPSLPNCHSGTAVFFVSLTSDFWVGKEEVFKQLLTPKTKACSRSLASLGNWNFVIILLTSDTSLLIYSGHQRWEHSIRLSASLPQNNRIFSQLDAFLAPRQSRRSGHLAQRGRGKLTGTYFEWNQHRPSQNSHPRHLHLHRCSK